MSTRILQISALTVAVCLPFAARAQTAAPGQETARVVSSTPIVQKLASPQQVCNNAQVVTAAPSTGTGALVGALAGGATGSVIGQGAGRVAATALGIVGGAAVGDRLEAGGSTSVQNVQQCATKSVYQDTVVGYNVTYEYASKQYTVQMAADPGPTLTIQVSPIGASTSQAANTQAPTYGQTVYTQPGQQVVLAPAVVAAYPAPYYYPYYPPVGLSLGIGWGGRGHWR